VRAVEQATGRPIKEVRCAADGSFSVIPGGQDDYSDNNLETPEQLMKAL
jgi:hypothetical protein